MLTVPPAPPSSPPRSRSTFTDDPAAPRHLVRTWLLAADSPHRLPARLMFPRSYSLAPPTAASAAADNTDDTANAHDAAPPAAASRLTPSMAAAFEGGLMPSVYKMPRSCLYVPLSSGERA